MKRPKIVAVLALGVGISSLLFGGCRREGIQSVDKPLEPSAQQVVTLYCSVDDVYAKPIVKELEQRTGLRIDVLYDTEATKTAGLANRIRAERQRPRGDVFWSSALLQTLLLKREGLLASYKPKSANDIPSAFKDGEGFWTGVGTRDRVIVYEGLKTAPRTLEELLAPGLRGKVGISNPQFGTASDWVAALGSRWGIERTKLYFANLKRNDLRVLAGNSVVAERVARGEIAAGVIDTDDYLAQKAKDPALQLAATQPPRAINRMPIPGAVVLIKDAPHPDAAQRLIDAIAGAEGEKLLIEKMPGVVSVRTPTVARDSIPVDAAQWLAAWDKLRDPLADLLLAN